ncbi:hypothetical protein B0H13DRAFT_2666185 [Mycena leptocephala]|nr:hypothetical protein B0H13DRAFT_2666185 [Mycena leptocephala]
MSTDATVPTTVGPTFAQLFGPVFWALFLCGVTVLQGYQYFTRYNDKLWVRLMAAIMLVLDLLSMALICQSMYYYMLLHFGSLAPLNAVTKELTVECLISAVIAFILQMYFVYQLYILRSPGSTATVMTALVGVLGTVGLGGAAGFVAIMFMFPQSIVVNRNHAFAVLNGIAKGFSAGADIVATIAMCMFLKSADTGFKRTSSMLRSLIHVAITRGILVTAAQILLLVIFFATTGHLYWLAVHITTTKLYVNTFFGMLNARGIIRERDVATTPHTFLNDVSANYKGLFSDIGAREKQADLNTQDYTTSAIPVTSSTVADI